MNMYKHNKEAHELFMRNNELKHAGTITPLEWQQRFIALRDEWDAPHLSQETLTVQEFLQNANNYPSSSSHGKIRPRPDN